MGEKNMTRAEFELQLSKIVDETNEKVVTLVLKAREEEFGEFDMDKPMPYADDPNWERKADSLAEMCGWIYDRMNGKTRLDKRSMRRKIRRALGYTYP